eukprot:TRINITY_DN1574_c0_g1_i2.p1 TRINITY_DN1574_c0_g1~~TRINITY_DN1574_c0_g1_i2.p1  ORF type:complete len:838 (-),score=209.26 TRINITY_DN1574_c0_g1_i2:730-3051(-)
MCTISNKSLTISPGNRLQDIFGEKVFAVERFLQLTFENNSIQAIPDGFFMDCVHLHTLTLAGNSLCVLYENAFQGLANLSTLSLARNNLKSIPATLLFELQSLQSVDMSFNDISEIPSELFSKCSDLQQIRFAANHITGIDKNTFRGLSNLKILDLNSNPLKSLPDGLLQDCPLLNEGGKAVYLPGACSVNLENLFLSEIRPAVEIAPGLQYIGQWQGMVRHGKGTLLWSDGKKYEGTFKNNQVVIGDSSPTVYFARVYDEQKSYFPGDEVLVIAQSGQHLLQLADGAVKWVHSSQLVKPSREPYSVEAIQNGPDGKFSQGATFEVLCDHPITSEVLVKNCENDKSKPYWISRNYFAELKSEWMISVQLANNIKYSGMWRNGRPHGRGTIIIGPREERFDANFVNGNMKIDVGKCSVERYYAIGNDEGHWKAGEAISVVGKTSGKLYLVRARQDAFGEESFQFVEKAQFVKEFDDPFKSVAVRDEYHLKYRIGDEVTCLAARGSRVLIQLKNNSNPIWSWKADFGLEADAARGPNAIGVSANNRPSSDSIAGPGNHRSILQSAKPKSSENSNFSNFLYEVPKLDYASQSQEEKLLNLGLEYKSVEIAEGLRYTGYWLGEERQGSGVLEWSDGDRFSGKFLANQPVIGDEAALIPCYFADDSTHAEFKAGELVHIIAYSDRQTRCLCLGSNQPAWVSLSKVVPVDREPYMMKTVCKDVLGRFDQGHIVTVLAQSLDGMSALVDINQPGVAAFWLGFFMLDPLEVDDVKRDEGLL